MHAHYCWLWVILPAGKVQHIQQYACYTCSTMACRAQRGKSDNFVWKQAWVPGLMLFGSFVVSTREEQALRWALGMEGAVLDGRVKHWLRHVITNVCWPDAPLNFCCTYLM
jgi:hypothetical protein